MLGKKLANLRNSRKPGAAKPEYKGRAGKAGGQAKRQAGRGDSRPRAHDRAFLMFF